MNFKSVMMWKLAMMVKFMLPMVLKASFLFIPHNGNLLRTVNFPLARKYIEYIYFDGKFLCYNQNNLADIENSFNVVDTGGNIIKSFPNKYPFKRHSSAFGFNHENIFYRFNNQIFIKKFTVIPHFHSTI